MHAVKILYSTCAMLETSCSGISPHSSNPRITPNTPAIPPLAMPVPCSSSLSSSLGSYTIVTTNTHPPLFQGHTSLTPTPEMNLLAAVVPSPLRNPALPAILHQSCRLLRQILLHRCSQHDSYNVDRRWPRA